jgi:hypothetical protein
MNEEQRTHRQQLASKAFALIWDKYEKGALEHKTILNKDFSAEQLLDFAIEEAIDQITYLLTLKEKI